MRSYNRIISTFTSKLAKLEKLAEKDGVKIIKLRDRAEKAQEKINAKIAVLMIRQAELKEEAAACEITANKLMELLS